MKRKMNSKKHHVYLVDNVIEKHFTSPEAFRKERDILSQLTFPEIYGYDEEALVLKMTYIPGKTLLEVLEHCEEVQLVDKAFDTIIQAFESLNHFHERFQNVIRFYDMNFRNFIVLEKVHMVDFETVQAGDIRLDYIDMIAMMMHYDPVHSSFKERLFNKLKADVLIRLEMTECEFDTLYTNAVAKLLGRRG